MSRHIEQERTELTNNPDILVVGSGEVGAKARQLIDKTPTLRAFGFRTPHRTVLAEGFFDDFFQRSGLGSNLREVNVQVDTEAAIRSGSFSSEQFETLQAICRSYGASPLVVRSSAEGDARGTGTYKSEFTENRIGHFRKGLQRVLASYFSPDAVAFRQDAATGEGFGVIVEPIIGHDFDGMIAPVLSGFGYTSTSRGEGYLTIVPGLGCGVESRDGERITKSQLDQHGGALDDYIYAERDAIFHGWKAPKRSALLRTDRHFSDSYSARAFFPPNRYRRAGEVVDTSIDYPNDIKQVLYDLNLTPVFSAMGRMEQTFGKPQYFEWAMTAENGKPAFWIVQIADVDKKLDLMDFENFGRVMFMGHTVTGTGIKESSKIVNCWNPDDIYPLNRFNRENKDYVLIFSSRLTSVGGARDRLGYGDFSNASVFLEIQDAHHIGDPVAHLGGQLDMTGKLFAVLDYDAEVPPDWDLFRDGEQQEHDLPVYNGRIKVIGSERQNKLVVYDQDK